MEDYFNYAKTLAVDLNSRTKDNQLPKNKTGTGLILQHSQDVMRSYARVVQAEKTDRLTYQAELLDLTYTCELMIDNLRKEIEK